VAGMIKRRPHCIGCRCRFRIFAGTAAIRPIGTHTISVSRWCEQNRAYELVRTFGVDCGA
jgi:hypothetical protein